MRKLSQMAGNEALIANGRYDADNNIRMVAAHCSECTH
jgi:hypothetical protein